MSNIEADDPIPDSISGTGENQKSPERGSYTASLLSQGSHRFYTLSMPSDVLAECCMVEPRYADPDEGFQRALDERRARDIAAYIDSGTGTIPSSIVLSAQPEADLQYNRPNRTLNFIVGSRAFLILDGQHRVYGFKLATSKLRVPVVIYNGLSRTEEARLFMDINTKQRPVPNELILDIKRMAETESDSEALMRDVFDLFNVEPDSPLFGLMSPYERKKGKISRVTFNGALKPILETFSGASAGYVYQVMSAYLHSCLGGMRQNGVADLIVNPVMFKALVILFPAVAERVADRHGAEFSIDNFSEILRPMFERVRKADLANPGKSPTSLVDIFKKAMRSGFTIGMGS
ncbi:DGQHR domain-containing protein [Aureimonas sp. D3]|uniref:DGQHR domain-containing protein n=1 Tax=Aureimonas sp. D3 TaxID=1638164 RepID=UPI0009E79E0F|nr:DGQHR domain-containing protein [Aureimonas sp. D3]